MTTMAIATALLFALVFCTGAAVGSFLNVCIARWPENLSVVKPRSRCPRCGHAISWYENVPVVSWLALRGRCSGCRLPISAQYPAVELGVGLGWLAAFAAYPGDWFLALRLAVFGTVLAGIAVTDLKHYLIPDGFTVFGLIWVVATALIALVRGDQTMFATPYEALIGACVGAGAISIIGWLGEVALGKEAMGFGDVTLMAVVGAAVGPTRALLTIFVGAALGAVIFVAFVLPILWLRGKIKTGEGLPQVPFGVFLAPAALVTLLKGDAAIVWYLSRLGLR
jgi:leader peptidase (prepilin peptidase) / N-methyltransferase